NGIEFLNVRSSMPSNESTKRFTSCFTANAASLKPRLFNIE
ncbi:hypothetical protein D039_0174B, partial [Vibrio parahaemolyticus EKP-028]